MTCGLSTARDPIQACEAKLSLDSSWPRAFGNATAASIYNEIMLPRMFIPWANLLLDAVGIHPGDQVLDVACGPGTVAHLAATRSSLGGYVLGCDLNAAMLDLATANAPDAAARMDWRQAPADALPAPSASFDVVTCQQGLQFFPDRPAALREMHRVLRSGGRLGLAVWASIDKCPPFAAAGAAVTEVIGASTGALYASGPWGWPDLTSIADVVAGAGFLDLDVTTRREPVTFEGGARQFVQVLLTSAIADQIRQLDAASVARLENAIAEHARDIMRSGSIESFLTSHLLIAHS
jgi:ubiquinone/menaquinone biosynthesis C-methylase UbiE